MAENQETETPEITPELIELAKIMDIRLRIIEMGLDVERELNESRVVRLILDTAKEEADTALEKLWQANPADTKEIIALQAAVYRARSIGALIDRVLRASQMAHESVREEDTNSQHED